MADQVGGGKSETANGQLKAQGNAAFAAKDFAKAVDFFTQVSY